MFKFQNLSIGKKTLSGFGVLILVFWVAIGTILYESFAISASMEVVRHETEMLDLAKEVETQALSVITYFGAVAASTDEAGLKVAVTAISKHREMYGKHLGSLHSIAKSPNTKSLITAMSEALAAIREPNDRVLRFAREGKHLDAARVYTKESIPGIAKWQGTCVALAGELQRKSDEAAEVARQSIRTELETIAAAGIVATLMALLLGVVLAKGITRPIHKFQEALNAFSEADFTVEVEIESTDEIGQLGETLNLTIQRLRATFEDVTDAALAVSSGANQLSATSDEMSRATYEIARGGETIQVATVSVAAAILQFQARVDQVESNVQVSVHQTADSVTAADAGILATRAIEERMNRIQTATSRIANAVSVIREIAQQTNLLSLNAAIEAAKAGQQGKGFSVVAEEVRKLAERSRQATVEIAALIEETDVAVGDGTHSTKDTVRQIQGIHDAIALVSSQIQQIGTAAHEQASTVGEITKRIDETSREVGQNAAATHELSATVEQVNRTASELASVAEKLRNMVSTFRL